MREQRHTLQRLWTTTEQKTDCYLLHMPVNSKLPMMQFPIYTNVHHVICEVRGDASDHRYDLYKWHASFTKATPCGYQLQPKAVAVKSYSVQNILPIMGMIILAFDHRTISITKISAHQQWDTFNKINLVHIMVP